jgi:putative ABC transport system permease protein
VRIDSGHGLSGDAATGAVHPTVPVFVFPLLLVAGAAGILARVLRFVLQRMSGRAGRMRSAPLYLAVRRLAAAHGLLVVLAVVTATALGAFTYAESLAASLGHSTAEKAYVATGSDAEASIAPEQSVPKLTRYPITKIEFSNQNVSLNAADGIQADVMLVDPATMPAVLHWQSGWGPSPAALLRRIGAASASGGLPVVVTPDAAGVRSLSAAGGRIPVQVVGTVKVFPGMASGIPLVITSYRAMSAASARARLDDPLGTLQAYVWAKGPPDEVERWLESSTLGTYYASSTETFLRDPGVLLATRTYSFMRTVALAAAVLVLLGLLLYLQSRQRAQVIASALGRRMGFGSRAEAASVAVELLSILAFAAAVGGGIAILAAGPVVRNIDPLPQDPPGPVFGAPVGELVVAAAALVVVAALAGAITTWAARRADPSQELRVA